MKQLDTLVPDIYSLLEGLSNGEPLPLSEAAIEATVVGSVVV